MACYSPMFVDGRHPGKNGVVHQVAGRRVKVGRHQVPCGKCIGCRLEKSRSWAVRIMLEAQLHEFNWFLTLTLEDQGEGSLDKSLFPAFMKRLREKVPRGVRYYHCGEYGQVCADCKLSKVRCQCEVFKPTLGRPHYHACVFNLPLSDLKYWKRSQGNRLYRSKLVEEAWTHGHVLIGALTFESAAYVSRYVVKKMNGAKAEAHYAGRIPEFATMSRRPGIGAGWFSRFRDDVYNYDLVIARGRPMRPPRYLDKLLSKSDPARYDQVKQDRDRLPWWEMESVARRRAREEYQYHRLRLGRRSFHEE